MSSPRVPRNSLTPDERQALVAANLGLIGSVLHRYYPHATEYDPRLWRIGSWDDAFQAGVLGLIAAVERFDPSRGCQLSTYATPWIHQAIARGQVSGAPIHVPPMATRKGRFRREAFAALVMVPLGGVGGVDRAYHEPEDDTEDLWLAVGRLSAADKELLRLRYDEGLTFKEIGQRYGFTKSAAEQKHKRIIRRLRQCLEPVYA